MSDDLDDVLNPKKRGLGRGLNALFEDEEGVYPQVDPEGHTPGRRRDALPIEVLEPGASQPRMQFDEEALDELAGSIRQHGLLQPLLVRIKPGSEDIYEIIAGERRWRASQMAQLHEVPVIVLDINDVEAMQIALIENLQREDLNPLEEAEGYNKLLDEHDYTQEQLAEVMGKSRSHIANMVRLTSLPYPVQALVRSRQLSSGHARALVPAGDSTALAQEIVKKGLNVRQTEALVAKNQGRTPSKSAKKAHVSTKGPDTLALEEEIATQLGMKISIDSKDGKKGSVQIEFKNLDQLDVLVQRLSGYGNTPRLMG